MEFYVVLSRISIIYKLRLSASIKVENIVSSKQSFENAFDRLQSNIHTLSTCMYVAKVTNFNRTW